MVLLADLALPGEADLELAGEADLELPGEDDLELPAEEGDLLEEGDLELEGEADLELLEAELGEGERLAPEDLDELDGFGLLVFGLLPPPIFPLRLRRSTLNAC